MSGQQGETSIHGRFIGRIETLTLWWSDYFSSIQRRHFTEGCSYSPHRQVDLMLSAIALGASRWAHTPHARVRRGRRLETNLKPAWGRRNAQELQALELVVLLAACVQRGAAKSTANCRVEGDMASLFVTIQLGAMQCAASEVFGALYPPATVLETLRLSLLDELPPAFQWCA